MSATMLNAPQTWRFTHLDLRHLGGNRWQVRTEFQYLHPDRLFVVPEGFITDLDSVPRIPIVYAVVKGRAVESAVIHDMLYRNREPRLYADRILWDGMGHQGIGDAHRWPIWTGVRSGGWLAYRRKGND